jgi:Tfp pilus assembly protein PilF
MACFALTTRAAPSRAFHLRQTPSDNNSRAAALVSDGAAAIERGDLSSAKNYFEQALKIDPNNVPAHTYLGVLADHAGDLAEAERHFAAAAIADPLSPSARNNHGAILLRLGRTKQAAAQFETSLRLDHDQPAALMNLAQIRFASGTPEGLRSAFELFEHAWTIAPDAEIARSLIVIALRLNDKAAAAKYFHEYAGRIEGATSRITTPTARAEIGTAMLEAGLLDEAVEELNATVKADPSNVKAILALARAYMSRKEIASAGRTLESAVARGIQAGPIYAFLADVYQASGHIENAIPAMRLAIEVDPGNDAYRFRYAMLLTDTNAPAAAIIRLQEALKEFPRSAKLWFALGVAQLTYRKHDEAATSFQRVIDLDPKFAPAFAYLGMTYDETARYAEAIAFYERALAVDEKLAAAHYLLADAILRQPEADLARAEQHLVRAIELDQTFPPGRLALAKLYVRLKRFTDAATQLERVVADEPNLTEAHYQLGHVYARLKRPADAEREFAIFKRLGDKQQEESLSNRRELVRRLANVRF